MYLNKFIVSELYGSVEMEGQLKNLKGQLDTFSVYNKEYSELTEDEKKTYDELTFNKLRETYTKIKDAVDKGEIAYQNILKEVEDKEKQLQDSSDMMLAYKDKSKKEHSDYGFTNEELEIINTLYHDTDYANENIFTTSLQDTVTALDKMEELYQDAVKELFSASRPQYQFTVDMYNLFAIEEFLVFQDDFRLGNFIRVGRSNDIFEKLRITVMEYNPLVEEPDIRVTFSNMVYEVNGRSDITTMFDQAISHGKNSIQYGNANSGSDSDIELSTDIIELLNRSLSKTNGNKFEELLATTLKCNNIVGNYAKFDTIDVTNINVDSSTFDKLITKYADIKYANIDFANVDVATIRQGFMKNLMIEQKLIANDVTAAQGTFTGYLTGVNIVGDLITAGTIKTERLIITGGDDGEDKSVMYFINNNGLSEVDISDLTVEEQEKYMLNGKNIIANTITANKINVTDLVATGLVEANKLTSNNIDVVDLLVHGFIDANRINANNINVEDLLVRGFIDANKIKANNLDVLGLTVTRPSDGLKTLEIDEDGNVSLNVKSLKILSSDVATEDYTDNKVDEATSLSIILSNDSYVVSTDEDGSNGDYSECNTVVQVLFGAIDVTDKCTINVSKSDWITGSWDAANYKYTVTDMTQDEGIVLFNIEYTTTKGRKINASKGFSIAKSKQGNTVNIYDVDIYSSNGNFFKNGAISTTLSCHVFKNSEEITDTINASAFHWYKILNDGTHDTDWETKHFGGTKEVTITTDDVYGRATFECHVDGIPPQ